MSVLVLMQNLWVKEPDRLRATLARHPEARRRIIKSLLFMGCKTGRILLADWGEYVCQHCEWEESTAKIADNPKTIFQPDVGHIAAVLNAVHPEIVVLLGRQATNDFAEAHGKCTDNFPVNVLPAQHPCAHSPFVRTRLQEIGVVLRKHFGV